MIDRQELEQILHFIAKRWVDITRESDNKAMKSLPANFWMNAVGGKAGKGRWLTMLMYTESEEDANALKEVLLRWQAKGLQNKSSSDLIQIGKK
ncbi:MAG: conserved hypothetical protein [Marine Group I thaumarchaeote]|nr:MAG: conserved hypothetical protein [Marine Group I thaumarchaeote]